MPFIGNKPTAVPLSGADIEDGTIGLADLSATGTKDATTFLRGDNTFASAGGDNTPAFSAYLSSNQGVNSDTMSKIIFDTEYYDTNSAFDTSNGRFTVPAGEGGKYFLESFVWGVPSSGYGNMSAILINIYKNGSSFIQKGKIFRTDYNYSNVASTAIFPISLAAGDYVEIYAYLQNANNGLNYGANSSFSGYKIIT